MRSELPDGWSETTLECVAADIRYGYTASATSEPIGPRFVRITDIVSGQVDWASAPYCTIDPRAAGRLRLHQGDIVIARTGPVGAAARIDADLDAVFASYLVRVRIDPSLANDRFMAYVLRSPQWQAYVDSARTGSVQPQFNASLMKAFRFAAPPAREQERIATTLAALDDKIDSNRRLTGLLEETAATMFRARFVDFVGESHFVETDLGPTPKEWTVAPIGDILKVVGGSTPSTKDPRYWDGGTHCWATPKDLAETSSRVLLDTKRHITDAGVSRISSRLLPRRTVLLSSRAPVGYTAMSMVEVAVNQGFIAIPPSDRIPSEYVLCWLHENMDRIKAHAGGTTFAEISKRAFRPLLMVVPPAPALTEFGQAAGPMFDLLAGQGREIQTLSNIRDALLPKLISGEIRVPDTHDPDEVIGPVAEELAAATP